ncbi:hypothetical protein KBD20_03545 [Candidatus Saccharibacteria bacterium]|nr:hypothetical protein [Candidatus Saccharibacteria bacterium]
MAKKKNNLGENKAILAAGASTVLAALVLFKTFELVQNLKQNFQGAPNSYAHGLHWHWLYMHSS